MNTFKKGFVLTGGTKNSWYEVGNNLTFVEEIKSIYS